jgi:hypothetical protein
MYLLVRYYVQLDITSCAAFYADHDEQLRAMLEKQYVGVCMDGCLIVEIVRIVREGECQFTDPLNPCQGYLSVAFLARVIQYATGDIIGGCIASSRLSGGERVPALSKYAEIIFARESEAQIRDELLKVVVEGAAILGVARMVLAKPGAPRISMCASIFEPIARTQYYPVVGWQNVMTDEAMTRESYWFPEMNRESADGVRARDMARASYEEWRAVSAESAKIHESLIPVVRNLFYPFASAHVADRKRVADREHIATREVSLLDCNATDFKDATAIIIPPESHVFDARLFITDAPISSFPSDWIAARALQSCGVALARRFEEFADYMTAASEMLRAISDQKVAAASLALINAQTSDKSRALH